MDPVRSKRIIYLVLGMLLLGFLIAAVYISLRPAEETKRPTQERVTSRLPEFLNIFGGEEIAPEEKPAGKIAGAPEEKLIRITDFPVVSPALDAKGERLLFYKKDGGDLLSLDFNGQNQEKISNITIVGIVEVMWSPLKDRAAVFYLDGEIKKGFLHIGTSSVAVLPQNVLSFSWSPDGKSFAYLISQDDRLNLVTADSSARNSRTIFTTPLPDASINWITADQVAFLTAPSGLAEGYLYLLSRAASTFQKVIGPLFGLSALWSPDGSRVLTAATDAAGKNISLAVHESSGQEIFFSGAKTLPEKCAWRGKNLIYCAVPRTIAPQGVFPDDYLSGEINTSDRILLLDLERKEAREILAEGSFDMANLLVSPDQKNLFFVNRADGTLWMYRLVQ